MPQYVTVILPVPDNVQSTANLFSFFYGMSLTVTDEEMGVFVQEISAILGDMLPDGMLEEVRNHIDKNTDARRNGIASLAKVVADRIVHLPEDESTPPGQA